jgi:mono/diheme cytochrome c family protein
MRRAAALLPLLLLAACDGWPESPPPPPPAPPPAGAVPQGAAERRAALAPLGPPADAALLRLGAGRYAIYCTPCHGTRGLGDGPVVARGFPRPPPLPGDALRVMAAIAENRAGAHPFDDRIPPRERWAIARHVEAMRGAATPGLAPATRGQAGR